MANSSLGINVNITGTEEADRKLNDLERKIKRMRESGPGGNMAALAQQYRSAGDNQKADNMERARNQARSISMAKLKNDIASAEKAQSRYNAQLDKATSKINTLTAGTKAHTAAVNEGATAAERLAINTERIAKAKAQHDQMKYGPGAFGISGKDLSGVYNAFSKGGPTHGIRAIGGVAKRMGPGAVGAMAGSAISGIGAGIKAGGDLAYKIGTSGERRTAAEAGIAGMLGETADLQARRRSYEMNYYGPERAKALDTAMNRERFSRIKDKTDIAGSVLGGIGTGIATGAGIGAGVGGAIGALGGPITAGIGAAGGAAIGGLIGGGASLLGMAGDDTKRSFIGGQLGMEDQQSFYDTIKSGEAAKVYKEQLELNKAKSFEKRGAQKYLEKNKVQFLNTQRQFGMSDSELFLGEGSLLKRGARAGFQEPDILGSMQQISGAGGTTRMAQEGAIGASQMARGLNLSNAGQMLGQISGGTGMQFEGSKDELIRMFAEGQKIGYDSSDSAKEMRSFLGTASSMAYERGTSFQGTAALLGSGMGGPGSERDIRASRDALEKVRQETGQMGGLTGQYKIAALANMTIGGKEGSRTLSKGEMARLSGMGIDEMTEDNEYLQTMLKRRGLEADSEEGKKFIQQLKKNTAQSLYRDPEQAKIAEEYRKASKEVKDAGENVTPEQTAALKDAQARMSEMSAMTKGVDYMGMDEKQRKSYDRMIASAQGEGGEDSDAYKKAKKDFDENMKRKKGKRILDDEKGAGAADAAAELGRLELKAKELRTAFNTTTEQTINLGKAMAALMDAINNKDADAAKELMPKVKKLMTIDEADKSIDIKDGETNYSGTTDGGNSGGDGSGGGSNLIDKTLGR